MLIAKHDPAHACTLKFKLALCSGGDRALCGVVKLIAEDPQRVARNVVAVFDRRVCASSPSLRLCECLVDLALKLRGLLFLHDFLIVLGWS